DSGSGLLMAGPDFRHNYLLLLILLVQLLAGGCREEVDVAASITAAQQHEASGRHRAAIIELKNAIHKSSNHAEAHFLLGFAYTRTGEFDLASTELRRAQELKYDSAQVELALLKTMLATGKFQTVLDQTRFGIGGDAKVGITGDPGMRAA